MKYAGLLGQASRVAAEVYRSLPRAQRKHALYRALTGQAMQLLKAGTEATMVVEQLKQQCVMVQQTTVISDIPVSSTATVATAIIPTVLTNPATTRSAGVPAPAKPVIKRKAAPPAHLQTKYARIFVHPSGRISATGLTDAVANKGRRRLLASVEGRE